jgi:hypothetical protein
MKTILFVFVLFFSANSISATAITLNGQSWKTIHGSYDSIQSTYAACGINGDPCDSSGWRWANQSEVNLLINDFFQADIPLSTTTYLETESFFNYFDTDFIESAGKYIWTLSSDMISENNGVATYGEKDFITIIATGRWSPDGYVTTAVGGSVNNDYKNEFYPWYWLSGFQLYPFSLIMVKGEYDSSLGITYPISPVPLPASLFLFAPALLVFLGLRRKANLS